MFLSHFFLVIFICMCLYESGVNASECLQRSDGVLCPLKLELKVTVSHTDSSPLKIRQSSSLLRCLFILLHISSIASYKKVLHV